MLEAIDKYKFGILAAIGSYMVLFAYLNLSSYKEYFVIEGYEQTGEIMPEEEFQLKAENIEMPKNFDEEVLNMANNVSDDRATSTDKFYENKSMQEIAEDITALEQQMMQEAGGSEKRAELQAMIDARRKKKEQLNQGVGKKDPAATQGGATKTAHKTMVDFDLGGRDAYQNNKWYVRNPGYKCDNAYKVTVHVDVQVNTSGDVVAAVYNASKSSGASSCEINTAVKYAKMSRFEHQAIGGNSGWIQYIFMP
ncbi:hypothetical protein OAU25_00265 [Crocinitomicaceae bacterium]|nr:hypothetical protein [Crocinitomicaceae bacterium]